MVRPEEVDEKARFEDGEPAAGRGVGDPAVVAKGAETEKLPVAARAEAHETAEGLEIAHVDDLPYIPLHVGLVVARIPGGRVEALVVDPRIEAAEEGLHEIRRALSPAPGKLVSQGLQREGLPSVKLTERKREQVEDRAPPGEGLADGAQEEEVLRSAQDEPPRAILAVDDRLDVGEQIGGALHLVEDDTPRELPEEPARIFERIFPDVGIFERRVLVAGEYRLDERGLSRLARTGEGDHGILPRQLFENRFEDSSDHAD